MDGFRERAKGLDQGLGQRLDVAARDDAEQHHFEQFVVAERAGPRLAKTFAQPYPMAVIMRRLLARFLVNRIVRLAAHRLQCAVTVDFCNREVRPMPKRQPTQLWFEQRVADLYMSLHSPTFLALSPWTPPAGDAPKKA